MRVLTRVLEKIDYAYGPNDSGGPRVWSAAGQRRRALARKLLSELPAQDGVFLVQVFPAKRVHHSDDYLKSFADVTGRCLWLDLARRSSMCSGPRLNRKNG